MITREFLRVLHISVDFNWRRLCFKSGTSGGDKGNKMTWSLRLNLVWSANKKLFSIAGTNQERRRSHQRKAFVLYVVKTDWIHHENCTKIISTDIVAAFEWKSRRYLSSMIFIVCVKQIYEEYKYTFAIFLYEKVVIFYADMTSLRVYEFLNG
jgi:hypothetical protein